METTNPTPPNTHKKLPRLPHSKFSFSSPLLLPTRTRIKQLTTPASSHTDLRIHKRPLTHPPIPSPYTASSTTAPKAIYISPHTPFVSALKRTRKLLAEIDKRSLGNINLVDSKASDRDRLRATARSDKNRGKGKGKETGQEEVVLKGTGKAIERVLGLAVFLQGESDLRVRLRTGTVGVVDDVVVREGKVEGMGTEGGGEAGGKEHEQSQEIPESWVRKASMVEVAVSLR